MPNYETGVENGDGYGQANYYPSLSPGTGPIQVRRGFDTEYEEVTVNMRWKVSPNMEFSTGSNNKKIYFLEASNTHPIILGIKAQGAFYLATQRTAQPSGGALQLEGGQWAPGVQYDIKLYIKLNTVDANGNSNPDGIGTVWVDGVRVIHNTSYRFRGNDTYVSGETWEPTDGIQGIRWNPTWPNGGDPPAEYMWERIYDLAVYSGFYAGFDPPPDGTTDPPPEPPPPEPPPPDTTTPSFVTPNEPAGLIRIAAHDFSCRPGEGCAIAGQWTERSSTTSNLTFLNTGTDTVARLRFPTGQNDGTSPVRFDGWGPTIDESGGNPYDEIYVSFWLKIEGSDFENQSVGTKVIYIAYGSTIRTNHSTMFLGGAGFQSIMTSMTPLYFIYEMENDGSDAGGGSVARWPNLASNKIIPGGWQHIEMHFKINDIGPTTDNGEYRMWVDGDKTHEYTNLRWRSDENPKGFYHMQVTPVWGGSGGDVRTRDDFWQMDKWYISGKNAGTTEPPPPPPPPPPSGTIYQLHVTTVRNSRLGIQAGLTNATPVYVELTRIDGAWDSVVHGTTAPGVTNVDFWIDTIQNSERLYRYEAPSGDLMPITLSAGSHIIRYQVNGDIPESGQVTIEVAPATDSPPPPPPPPASTATPVWIENFSTFTTETWKAQTPFRPYALIGPHLHSIETDSQGNWLKLRQDAGTPENFCQNNSAGFWREPVSVPNPQTILEGATEIWVEHGLIYSSNYHTAPPGHAKYTGTSTEDWFANGCTKNPDHKVMRLIMTDSLYKDVNGEGVRGTFATKDGNFGDAWSYSAPRRGNGRLTEQDGVNQAGRKHGNPNCRAWWNGKWHQYRGHLKRSSVRHATDGICEHYITDANDSSKWLLLNSMGGGDYLPVNNFDIWWTSWYSLNFGLNWNDRQEENIYFGFRNVTIYIDNPGWTF